MSFSAAGWQRIREAREPKHNHSGTRIGPRQAVFRRWRCRFFTSRDFSDHLACAILVTREEGNRWQLMEEGEQTRSL